MSASPAFRFWLSPALGTFVGLLFLFLTGLVHNEGWILELVRALHYLPNESRTILFSIVPVSEQYLLVEHILFVLQWTLLGLCVGWIIRRMFHDQASA